MRVIARNDEDRGFKFEGTKTGGPTDHIPIGKITSSMPRQWRVTVEWAASKKGALKSVVSVERKATRGWESIGKIPGGELFD